MKPITDSICRSFIDDSVLNNLLIDTLITTNSCSTVQYSIVGLPVLFIALFLPAFRLYSACCNFFFFGNFEVLFHDFPTWASFIVCQLFSFTVYTQVCFGFTIIILVIFTTFDTSLYISTPDT